MARSCCFLNETWPVNRTGQLTSGQLNEQSEDERAGLAVRCIGSSHVGRLPCKLGGSIVNTESYPAPLVLAITALWLLLSFFVHSSWLQMHWISKQGTWTEALEMWAAESTGFDAHVSATQLHVFSEFLGGMAFPRFVCMKLECATAQMMLAYADADLVFG